MQVKQEKGTAPTFKGQVDEEEPRKEQPVRRGAENGVGSQGSNFKDREVVNSVKCYKESKSCKDEKKVQSI